MPRSARLDGLGVVHHVMARGIEGRPVFRDDRDREEFVARRKPEERERGDERVLGGGAFVESLLEDGGSEPSPIRTVDDVLTEVSLAHSVAVEELLGPSRARRVTRDRAEFYRRAHEEAGQTLADLGRRTGRSQPAVWQAVQRARTVRRAEEP